MPINAAAAVALDHALGWMVEAAAPWSTPGAVKEWVRTQFEEDFDEEIRSLDEWQRWRPLLNRLFRYVGAVAALVAEVEAGPAGSPGELKEWHVALAIVIVKTICPGEPVHKGKICKKAVAGAAELVASLRQMLLDSGRRVAGLVG